MGLVGNHNDGRGAISLKSGADDFEFVLRVDDGRVEHVDRFCGDALATEHLIVELGFVGIAEAQLHERFGLRTRMGEPDFVGVAGVIEISGFERARGEIAAQHCNRVGFLQRIFFDEPVADAEHESESGGKSEKGESAEDCEDSEQLAWEIPGAISYVPLDCRYVIHTTFYHLHVAVGSAFVVPKGARWVRLGSA